MKILFAVAVLLVPTLAHAQKSATYEVVIYGGTSAAVPAAVQAADMGKTVVVIEPGKHVGGLTSGGLGATDIGNKAAIGGLSRSFYRRIADYYAKDSAWKWQKPSQYRSRRQRGNEKAMWTFEPHVAEAVLRQMLAEKKVPVVFGERLDLRNGVSKTGGRITAIRMESGRTFRGKMFLDCTYEGDLMAKAGVSYTVGREANSKYGETLNGVQVRNAIHHQFIKPVDPYVVPGNPKSGLLPGINPSPPAKDGSGDRRVQAYCFRMCTTDVPQNRRAWEKPKGYDPKQFELLLRNCEAGDHRIPWNPIFMPNRKTDTNNNFAISTDFIGQNYGYPEADYKTRETIFQRHLSYQKGLMWTLANHPRVPEKVRAHFQRLGLAKDEFTDTDNWPHQLYVREARRMVSDYVMTQHDCQGRREPKHAVGFAAYTMDSHNIQRYVDKTGHVRNEGDVQVGGFSPYPIAYESIRPKKSECENLLVPVCLSATHISYGSIRMEPVFMVLGQSAATAACIAIDDNVAVQEISYAKLQKRLLADKQVLKWIGPRRKPPVDPKSLPGIVLDDADAKLTGTWLSSRSVSGYVGQHYLHDGNTAKAGKKAAFTPAIPKAGKYDVRLSWTPNPNRATNVKVVIRHADGEKTVIVNQKQKPQLGRFQSLGTFRFSAGKSGSVTILAAGTNGYVILDAVQFLTEEQAKRGK
jgi:FAD dependent oxidoreductase